MSRAYLEKRRASQQNIGSRMKETCEITVLFVIPRQACFL
ncbi:hypothetical protein DBB_11680 [Desulfoluna spongiiphila]|nr:hypothetical protein DBB_11680 [Desulfoluna spongiiphila]